MWLELYTMVALVIEQRAIFHTVEKGKGIGDVVERLNIA